MFDFSRFFEATGEELQRRQAAAAAAVEEFAHVAIIGQAQEHTPIETGALMASATVGQVQVTAAGISVEVGYGASYAAARHEGLPEEDAAPKVNPSGTAGNKFLERTMRDAAPKFTTFVGQRLAPEGGK